MLTAILEVSAQYQVSVLNATKDAVSMRCVGYGKKATIASMDAELSAIKTLLFVGTQKTQHSMPLVQEDKAVVENKYKKFFDAFYSKEYQNFVESSIIVTPYGKNALKQKCITLDVCIRVNQLRTYLENNGIMILLLAVFLSSMAWAQTATVQPKIMVIPYTKQGEDISQVIENDVNKRIVLAKIREAFDSRGFTTVDFAAKLKSLSRTSGLSQESQSDLKSMIIQQSGADIYVEAEMDIVLSSTGNSVKTILTAYDISTGGSLSNKVGESGKFYTEDIGKLGAKAVEKVADEFLDIIQVKFTDIVNNGRSINVDFSFEQTASISMSTEIGNDGLTLSDQLELWMSEHAYKNNYHIQGTTDKRMIFDDVRIPLKDDNGNNYNINKFGLEFLKFARSIGLQITRSTANNTLVITFK